MPDRNQESSDIESIVIEATASSFWQKEQKRAQKDLKREALFQHKKIKNKPYRINIRKSDKKLVFDITGHDQQGEHSLILSFSPYKRMISDYYLMIDSYEQIRSTGNLQKLEAIDMGRRGLHNEGAEYLRERLQETIEMDHETARHFFTLMCTLWHN